jgi:pimeloyl-ACP methyl ester carboxylesterase
VRVTRVFELSGHRDLAWIEYGVPDGVPVMVFHGSPGTRLFFSPQAEAAARDGARLIAPDRPGYGHSTYDPVRSYEGWARDVGQLADHLGLETFAVLGTSSGGPNAAGCARFLGDRLIGCAIVSGPAPPEAQISTREMLRTNRIVRRLASVAPWWLRFAMGVGMRRGQREPEWSLAWMDRTLPPCDVAVIGRPEIRAALRDEFARPLSPTAAKAAVQDLRLELAPWGFALRDIATRVHVWHGNLDRNVVVENGIYQANGTPMRSCIDSPTKDTGSSMLTSTTFSAP